MNELQDFSVKKSNDCCIKAQDLPNTRMRRFTRGTFATLFAQVINSLGQLAVVPVFLAYWGNQLYGEWLTLSAAVAYISMLDFGMQMYVVNRLTQCYARGAIQEYTRVFHSAFFLSLVGSSAAVILLILALVVMPLDRWFQFTLTDHPTAALVAILLALQIVAAIPQGLIAGIYRTIGEYPRGVMIGNMQRIFFLVFTVLVVMAGGGLGAIAGIQLVPLVCGALYVWWDLRRRHPQIRLGVKERDLKLALSFLGPSFYFFLIQIATGITVQGSTLIVGAKLGAGSVAVFVTLRTLANMIRQVTGALNSTLWPDLTALEAQGRYQTLREIHLLMVKLLLIFSFCAAVFLHFMGKDVVALWTHGRIDYNAQLMDAFLLLLISQTPWMTSSVILAASNNHRVTSICYTASAFIGLGMGYFLSYRFGLPGVVYGLFIAEFFLCGWFPWFTCRMIGQKFSHFLVEVLLRGVPVFFLLYWVMHWCMLKVLPSGSEIIRLIILGIMVGVMGLGLGYLLWFNQPEKNRVQLFLLGLLHRRSKLCR